MAHGGVLGGAAAGDDTDGRGTGGDRRVAGRHGRRTGPPLPGRPRHPAAGAHRLRPRRRLHGRDRTRLGRQALAALDAHAPDAAALAARPRPARRPRRRGVRPGPRQAGTRAGGGPADRLRGRLRPAPGRRGGRRRGRRRLAGHRRASPTAARRPYIGIRMKCMEAAVRDRGIRTLDLFLTTLLDGGGLPDGLRAHAAEGHLPGAGGRDGATVRGVRAGRRAARGPDRLRDPDRDHPGDPRPRRHRDRAAA